MTKKDYIVLAKILRDTQILSEEGLHVWIQIRNALAEVCEKDNPNFKVEKFMKATESITD